jgi:hypothetical protein
MNNIDEHGHTAGGCVAGEGHSPPNHVRILGAAVGATGGTGNDNGHDDYESLLSFAPLSDAVRQPQVQGPTIANMATAMGLDAHTPTHDNDHLPLTSSNVQLSPLNGLQPLRFAAATSSSSLLPSTIPDSSSTTTPVAGGGGGGAAAGHSGGITLGQLSGNHPSIARSSSLPLPATLAAAIPSSTNGVITTTSSGIPLNNRRQRFLTATQTMTIPPPSAAAMAGPALAGGHAASLIPTPKAGKLSLASYNSNNNDGSLPALSSPQHGSGNNGYGVNLNVNVNAAPLMPSNPSPSPMTLAISMGVSPRAIAATRGEQATKRLSPRVDSLRSSAAAASALASAVGTTGGGGVPSYLRSISRSSRRHNSRSGRGGEWYREEREINTINTSDTAILSSSGLGSPLGIGMTMNISSSPLPPKAAHLAATGGRLTPALGRSRSSSAAPLSPLSGRYNHNNGNNSIINVNNNNGNGNMSGMTSNQTTARTSIGPSPSVDAFNGIPYTVTATISTLPSSIIGDDNMPYTPSPLAYPHDLHHYNEVSASSGIVMSSSPQHRMQLLHQHQRFVDTTVDAVIPPPSATVASAAYFPSSLSSSPLYPNHHHTANNSIGMNVNQHNHILSIDASLSLSMPSLPPELDGTDTPPI